MILIQVPESKGIILKVMIIIDHNSLKMITMDFFMSLLLENIMENIRIKPIE